MNRTVIAMLIILPILFIALISGCGSNPTGGGGGGATKIYTLTVYTTTEAPTNEVVGTVTAEPRSNWKYPSGTRVTLEAQATNLDYMFKQWTGGITGENSQVLFVMNSSKVVTAEFMINPSETYLFSADVTPEGAGTVEPWAGAYPSGTNMLVTAEGYGNFILDHWELDAAGSNNPVTVTMNRTKEVMAVFSTRNRILTVSVSPEGAGVVYKNPSGPDYVNGTVVTVSAEAATGYAFDHWSGDLSGSSNPTTITMSRNKHIYAVFSATLWDTRLVDAPAGGFVWIQTSLAIDPSNYPNISYAVMDSAGTYLKYAKWTGSAWQKEVVDSTSETASVDWSLGYYNSIALDSSGHPYIAYAGDAYSGEPGLKMAKKTGASWDIQTVEAGEVGKFCSIGLDSSNHPHIAYYDETSYGDLKYAEWTGTTWEISTIDINGGNQFTGKHTSLVVGHNDKPYISSYDSWNDHIFLTFWTGTTWETHIVSDTYGVTGYSAMAIDSSNNPYVVYEVWDGSHTYWPLKVAKWNGASFDVTTIEADPTRMSNFTDFSAYIDSHDVLHVCYAISDGHLYYAKLNGSTLTKAGPIDDVSHDNSVKVDSTGRPSVSYRGNDNLYYSKAVTWESF